MRNYAGDPLFLRRMYVDGGNLYVNDAISGVKALMATNDSAALSADFRARSLLQASFPHYRTQKCPYLIYNGKPRHLHHARKLADFV